MTRMTKVAEKEVVKSLISLMQESLLYINNSMVSAQLFFLQYVPQVYVSTYMYLHYIMLHWRQRCWGRVTKDDE